MKEQETAIPRRAMAVCVGEVFNQERVARARRDLRGRR